MYGSLSTDTRKRPVVSLYSVDAYRPAYGGPVSPAMVTMNLTQAYADARIKAARMTTEDKGATGHVLMYVYVNGVCVDIEHIYDDSKKGE